MATILEGLNQIAEKLGGAEGASNLEALNAISGALGGASDAADNAAAVANIAQNASGGGGSSDFSTARVTLECSVLDLAEDFTIIMSDADDDTKIAGFTIGENGVNTEMINKSVRYGAPEMVDIYLLRGSAIMAGGVSASDSGDYTISGNAEVINAGSVAEPFYAVAISGDCTISTKGRK